MDEKKEKNKKELLEKIQAEILACENLIKFRLEEYETAKAEVEVRLGFLRLQEEALKK